MLAFGGLFFLTRYTWTTEFADKSGFGTVNESFHLFLKEKEIADSFRPGQKNLSPPVNSVYGFKRLREESDVGIDFASSR